MRICILTIGDEITSGHVVDTNASYLASHLAGMGIQVECIVTIGDDPGRIASEVRRLLSRYQVILTTGGLGPTTDDVTKQGIAMALGRAISLNQKVLADLESRFADRSDSNRALLENIANLPEGCSIYRNPLGAAPGFAVREEEKIIFVLPGVPEEMKVIFENYVSDEIANLCKDSCSITRVITTFGLSESAISKTIANVIDASKVKIGYLPKPSGVEVRVTAMGVSRDETQEQLESIISRIVASLGDNVVSPDGKPVNVVVGELLIERRATIAVAESCTGGLIGHLLTEVAGISCCLDRDVVAYSNRAKIEILGVEAALIEKFGAVSEQVAAAMASGVRERSGALIGVSTTGIAGPGGGTPEKPVGTVFIGVALGDALRVEKGLFKGDRSGIKQRASFKALDMVRRMLILKG